MLRKISSMISFMILTFSFSFISAQSSMQISTSTEGYLILSDDQYRVEINPTTLYTSLSNIRSGLETVVSQPVIAIDDYQILENHIYYPERGLHLEFNLNPNGLIVSITSEVAQDVTWPKIDIDRQSHIIIPHHEGSYIPLSDPDWIEYLSNSYWNTTESLSMPFWGIETQSNISTYILENPFNNTIEFYDQENITSLIFTHRFPPNQAIDEPQVFIIKLDPLTTPIQPAIHFRNYLEAQNSIVTLDDKMEMIPQIQNLIGAPHAYIWGGELISPYDVLDGEWQNLAIIILDLINNEVGEPIDELKELLTTNDINIIQEVATEAPYPYLKGEFGRILSQIYELSPLYFEEQLSSYLLPKQERGGGISTRFINTLNDYGFSRFLLNTDSWVGPENHPQVADYAISQGYLFGVYDSFHSIHDPIYAGTDESWITAQFNQTLYDTGAIINEDGEQVRGFGQTGFRLNPITARPYVEQRVEQNFSNVNYSYYFVDADAFGEYADDFNPDNPMTQKEDVEERINRLNWISETYQVPIGSEGGFYQFAPTLTVAEGVFLPLIGWNDTDMKNSDSPYFIGTYYPSNRPSLFFQSTLLKEKYIKLFVDPRYRLPLYETVFHDSVLATAHWTSPSLKFSNVEEIIALTEMLYQVAPLYHLDLTTLEQTSSLINARFNAFMTTHSYSYQFPLTNFRHLDDDHLIQKTQFGDLVLIANFSNQPFFYETVEIPAMSLIWMLDEEVVTYSYNQ